MNTFDFSKSALIDKYYKEKFVFDLSNYFVVAGWKGLKYNQKPEVTPFTTIEDLHEHRPLAVEGSPAVYMGSGPWADEMQNYLFSGMFAYLYLTLKSIHKYLGFEEGIRFCKEFTFPCWVNDEQSCEDYDVIAVLKEAGIAPCKCEAENYVMMLDTVIPYMKSITSNYIEQLDASVLKEINFRLGELRNWARETKDEILSFYGLKVRKEYMPEGSDYPAQYFLLDSLSGFSKRFGVYSFEDIAGLNRERAPFTFGDITSFDGPVIPHYKDLPYMEEYMSYNDSPNSEDPFHEMTEQEKRENQLFNIIMNLKWDDEPYNKGGFTGLKDCWGRVLVPAQYESCQGIHDSRFLNNRDILVLVSENGRWAFTKRKYSHEKVMDFVFDEVNLIFQGYYVTRIGNKYGLFSQTGREILPTKMDDIYHPTVCESHIMYKQDGKYGILYNDGTMTKQLLDEVDPNDGGLLSVRAGKEWGYLDKEGNFVRERLHAYLEANGFNFDSMAIYKFGFPTDTDLEDCMTFEQMMENLKRHLHRHSVDVDVKGSILQDKAEIKMGLGRKALYYTLLPDGPTFCVDMQKPYQLKLLDDRYHDMALSWEGNKEAKEMLKAWLNARNRKTGVRNWAELAYEYNTVPMNENRQLCVSYAFRKKMDIKQISLDVFEQFDFPMIDFKS